MDINDKIQFWNNEIERAKEHGFYFDPDSVEEVVKEVEHLRDMLQRSRSHSRDRRKEVKVLQNANRNHKQELVRYGKALQEIYSTVQLTEIEIDNKTALRNIENIVIDAW